MPQKFLDYFRNFCSMNKWQQFFRDYLSFTKKERIGLMGLLFLILFIYFLPQLFSKPADEIFIDVNNEIRLALDTMQSRETGEEDEDITISTLTYSPSVSEKFSEGKLFQFDPNSLSEDGWKSLGLNAKTIRTIFNYRNKGGRFYKAEDLKKIWGLPEGFYARVEAYITIAKEKLPIQTAFTKSDYKKQENKVKNIDINSADTAAFIELPGIGSKLAARIVNFRNKLGGFYSINQIAETFGLPDSTFQKIKGHLIVSRDNVDKININTASKDILKQHPYIKWPLANAIVAYRDQHGPYKSIDDLKNISILDPSTADKIEPYLTY